MSYFYIISLRVDHLIDMNTKIVKDQTLILQKKIHLEAGNKCINHCIVDGKNAAAIGM